MARHSMTIERLEIVQPVKGSAMSEFLIGAHHRAPRHPQNLACLGKKVCVSPGRITGVSQTVPEEQEV